MGPARSRRLTPGSRPRMLVDALQGTSRATPQHQSPPLLRGMMTNDPAYYEQAHQHSSHHREEVLRSDLCGCFYCRKSFPPTAIGEWTEEVGGMGQTALCPRCGIDSVIGSASGLPVRKLDFLREMRRRFFGSQ